MKDLGTTKEYDLRIKALWEKLRHMSIWKR